MSTDPKKVKQMLEDYFVAKNDLRPAMMGIYNNGHFLAATNGHVLAEINIKNYPELAAIEDSVPEGETFPDYRNRQVMPLVEEDKAYQVPITKLFTNEEDIIEAGKKKKVTCPTCNGIGNTYHECNCEYCTEAHEEECWECEGDEKVWESESYRTFTDVNDGRFRSIYLNAAIKLFTALGIEEVEIYQHSPNKALLIQGEGVRCLVMPVMKEYQHIDGSEYMSLVKTITVGKKEAAV